MLIRLDIAIFHFINRMCSNPFFDRVMPLVSDLALSEFLVPVALILLLAKKKEIKIAGLLLLAGVTVSYASTVSLKHLWARPRPFHTLSGVHVLVKATGYAFPSGHASNSFMAAFLLSSAFKRHILFYCLALLVGFSRIYLGVHYPLDVFAGACLGVLIGFILLYSVKATAAITNEKDPRK